MVTEEINSKGEKITVNWWFEEIIERHDSNYCWWRVEGNGSDKGSIWHGTTWAFGSNPEFSEEITDKEQQEE